jgi:hypothetical protein
MNGVVKYWLLLFILLLPLLANADTKVPPRSYVQPSADNKFLFVMIAPIDINLDGITQNEAGKKEARRVRETYLSSGMYLNDGSTNPLWTVDWHSNRVFVSSDGEHVIRLGGYATELSEEALTFFRRNEVLRSYTISDLIDFKFLNGNFNTGWNDTLSLDDEKRTFCVSTSQKDSYVFDYTTGEMVSSRRPLRMFGAALAVIILGVTLVVFRHRWYKLGEKPKTSN